MSQNLNLAGCGLAVWDAGKSGSDPLLYKEPTLPMYNRNLRSLAQKYRRQTA